MLDPLLELDELYVLAGELLLVAGVELLLRLPARFSPAPFASFPAFDFPCASPAAGVRSARAPALPSACGPDPPPFRRRDGGRLSPARRASPSPAALPFRFAMIPGPRRDERRYIAPPAFPDCKFNCACCRDEGCYGSASAAPTPAFRGAETGLPTSPADVDGSRAQGWGLTRHPRPAPASRRTRGSAYSAV